MRLPSAFLLLLLSVAASAPARAQLLDAKVVSLDAARKMLAAADVEVRRNNWSVSVAIVDAAGTQLLASPRWCPDGTGCA